MTKAGERINGRRGVAIVLALLFLAMFACMAVALTTSANVNLIQTRNRANSQQAQAMAEAGLHLAQRHLGGLSLPGVDDAAGLHEAIAERMETVLNNSSMVADASVSWDATAVTVPTITLARPDGRTGQTNLRMAASGGADDNTTVTVTSTGTFDNASRTVRYNLTVQRGRSVMLDYGIASKSAIQMTGDARISGANTPSEGSIMSGSYSTTQAIRMTGNVSVSGDAAICNPNGQISKTQNVNIGGEQRVGIDEPEWPEVDISEFTQYATNIYTGNGGGDITLTNIRIPPNTNPTFSGNVTILGVVYVQSPNRVKFTGNANIIGAIVCDEPAVSNLNSNYLQFTGSVSTSGVENLPAEPQFDGLRALTGSFILAPGFSARFSGNMNTVNGCMVASEFQFSGDAAGRVKGSVLNLRDSQFTMTGNASLVIDRENANPSPAGLSGGYRLVCLSGSYSE